MLKTSIKSLITASSALFIFFVFLTFQLPNQVYASNPVKWQTEYAYFSASDFWIKINNQYFYAQGPTEFISDPSEPDQKYTTLEINWTEKNVPMRFYIYFRMKPTTGEWEVYDLRTYDGSKQGEWIFYNTTDAIGNGVSSLPGHKDYSYERRFVSKDGKAEIYCKDCEFNAFMNLSNTYSLEPNKSVINTRVHLPSEAHTVYVRLYDKNHQLVKDQADVRYEWSVDSNNSDSGNIVYIKDYGSNTYCPDGIYSPCPNLQADLRAVRPGHAKIIVRALKNSNLEIARTSFDVNVDPNGWQIQFNPKYHFATIEQGINTPAEVWLFQNGNKINYLGEVVFDWEEKPNKHILKILDNKVLVGNYCEYSSMKNPCPNSNVAAELIGLKLGTTNLSVTAKTIDGYQLTTVTTPINIVPKTVFSPSPAPLTTNITPTLSTTPPQPEKIAEINQKVQQLEEKVSQQEKVIQKQQTLLKKIQAEINKILKFFLPWWHTNSDSEIDG